LEDKTKKPGLIPGFFYAQKENALAPKKEHGSGKPTIKKEH
jgi:hypothetical protein